MSDDPIKKALRPLAQFIEQGVPFNQFLNIQVKLLQSGHCVLCVPFRSEWIGDVTRPALHGGVISTLIDACSGAATFTRMESVGDRISTVDLRVDYLRPGLSEDLYANSTVIRMGNRVAVCRTEVYNGGCPALGQEDLEPVASGTAVFNVVPR